MLKAIDFKKQNVYAVIKTISILLVVIGHSDFLTSHDFSVTNVISINLKAYQFTEQYIRAWIYSFHMQIFMMVSGALVCYSVAKYPFNEFFRRRVKRLLLPFMLCGVLFSVPIKYFTGYFGNYSILKAYVKSLILLQTSGHLWFLFVLFVISVSLFNTLKHIQNSKNKIILIIVSLFILYLINDYMNYNEIFQLYRIAEYSIFFVIGFFIEKFNINMKLHGIKNLTLVYILSVDVLASALLFKASDIASNNIILTNIILFFQAIAGCIIIWLISLVLMRVHIFDNKLYKALDRSAFDIYLYHEPLEFLLLYLLYVSKLLGLFNSNLGYVVLCVIRFFIPIVFSMIIGVLLQKVNPFIKKSLKLFIVR